MALDLRHWNLVVPLALSLGACNQRIPAGGSVDGTETGGDSNGDEQGEENGDDSGDGSNDCDEECEPGFVCAYGSCELQYWCNSDDSCVFGFDCIDGDYCGIPEADTCPPLPTTGIPLGNLGSGSLHFAQVDGDPQPDLLVVEQDRIRRVDGPDDAAQFTRPDGAPFPEVLRAIDTNGDGTEELYIAEADGSGVIASVGGEELPVPARLQDPWVGNVAGDATPELIGMDPDDPTSLVVVEFVEGGPGVLGTLTVPPDSHLLAPGPADGSGRQSIHLSRASHEGLELLTIADFVDGVIATELLGAKQPESFISGQGRLDDDGPVPLLVSVGPYGKTLRAPTLGAAMTLPFVSLAEEPQALRHGDAASVFIVAEGDQDLVRFEYAGGAFSCGETIETEEATRQMATGDFDGDGAADLATLGEGGAVYLYSFSE